MNTTQTKSPRAAKQNVNHRLCSLLKDPYMAFIPVNAISAILESQGFDGLAEGIYCGATGRVHEQVGASTWIVLTWHRMESGRYEVLAYVS